MTVFWSCPHPPQRRQVFFTKRKQGREWYVRHITPGNYSIRKLLNFQEKKYCLLLTKNVVRLSANKIAAEINFFSLERKTPSCRFGQAGMERWPYCTQIVKEECKSRLYTLNYNQHLNIQEKLSGIFLLVSIWSKHWLIVDWIVQFQFMYLNNNGQKNNTHWLHYRLSFRKQMVPLVKIERWTWTCYDLHKIIPQRIGKIKMHFEKNAKVPASSKCNTMLWILNLAACMHRTNVL